MKKYYRKCGVFCITLFTLCLSANGYTQVGIGTTTPNGGSILDIESTDKGVLIPRINIDNLSTIDPVSGGSPTGLLVYNSNTTTGPGFFYWDGTNWVIVGDGAGSDGWKITGNAGTTAGVNFIGTTDNVGLRVKTNDNNRFEFTANGRL